MLLFLINYKAIFFLKLKVKLDVPGTVLKTISLYLKYYIIITIIVDK